MTDLERLERALAVVAYVVVKHGAMYAPILERLEREVDAARTNSPVERARILLERYTKDSDRAVARRKALRVVDCKGRTARLTVQTAKFSR